MEDGVTNLMRINAIQQHALLVPTNCYLIADDLIHPAHERFQKKISDGPTALLSSLLNIQEPVYKGEKKPSYLPISSEVKLKSNQKLT